MATIRDLIRAVDETRKKHPYNSFSMAYLSVLQEKPFYNFITFANGMRESIQAISNDEIIRIIATEMVRIYNYTEAIRRTDLDISKEENLLIKHNKLRKECPYYDDVRDFVLHMQNPNINSFLYFIASSENLMKAISIIQKYYYDDGEKYRKILLESYDFDKKLPSFCETELLNKINDDLLKVSGIKNVQVNPRSIRKCYNDVIDGKQFLYNRNRYQDGDLYAVQDIGKKRFNQEDSVLIMKHPLNPNFKISVVADGMGGADAGDKISNYTVKTIAKWFRALNPMEYYTQPEKLQYEFIKTINEISDNVYERYNESEEVQEGRRSSSGTTITGIIVTRNKTIVTQVGDSRAFTVKNGKVSLITQDDSAAWPGDMFLQPYDVSAMSNSAIDDIRFYRKGNLILRCIGDKKLDASKQSFMISNDYDMILSMTDGAWEPLSLGEIEVVCSNTPLEKIADTLIFVATHKNAFRNFDLFDNELVEADKNLEEFYEKLNNGMLSYYDLAQYNESGNGKGNNLYKSEILAGKDNASVTVVGTENSRRRR